MVRRVPRARPAALAVPRDQQAARRRSANGRAVREQSVSIASAPLDPRRVLRVPLHALRRARLVEALAGRRVPSADRTRRRDLAGWRSRRRRGVLTGFARLTAAILAQSFYTGSVEDDWISPILNCPRSYVAAKDRTLEAEGSIPFQLH